MNAQAAAWHALLPHHHPDLADSAVIFVPCGEELFFEHRKLGIKSILRHILVDAVRAVAVQSDGKILRVGHSTAVSSDKLYYGDSAGH